MSGLPGARAAAAADGRQWLVAAVALVLVVAVVAALVGGGGGSRGSTISRGPGGWLAARRYLLARGARVTLIAEPLAGYVRGEPGEPSVAGAGEVSVRRLAAAGRRPARPGVLALVFPWQGQAAGSFDEAIDAHLARGGDLVLAYSGEEAGFEQLLGVWRSRPVGEVPLAPWRWRAFMRREWDLQPVDRPGALPGAPTGTAKDAAAGAANGAGTHTANGAGTGAANGAGTHTANGAGTNTAKGAGTGAAPGAAPASAGGSGARRPLRVWAPRVLPELGAGSRVLYTAPGGKAAVAVFRYHGGRVVMLPADALSNARLGEAGNADLLETLLRNLGRRWAFDEYHHGLVAAGPASGGLGRTADLLLAHLALLYLLGVLALARRQGPAWSEPARIAGSPAAFLLGLGALHHRLGHHHEAALLLLQRTRELDRALELPAALERQAANAGPAELVAIARQVARRRAGHPVTASGDPR
ncbi:MAG TPA: hypothetical protein VKY89_02240 [Thermoanaerobaculia bacterium]|nr:hypothetical protein [Thermoanaerobaculia bacterium]